MAHYKQYHEVWSLFSRSPSTYSLLSLRENFCHPLCYADFIKLALWICFLSSWDYSFIIITLKWVNFDKWSHHRGRKLEGYTYKRYSSISGVSNGTITTCHKHCNNSKMKIIYMKSIWSICSDSRPESICRMKNADHQSSMKNYIANTCYKTVKTKCRNKIFQAKIIKIVQSRQIFKNKWTKIFIISDII